MCDQGEVNAALLALGAVSAVLVAAIIVWRAAGDRRPKPLENRLWIYCPRCGWPRRDEEVAAPVSVRAGVAAGVPSGRPPVRPAGGTGLDAIEGPLPSDFLRAGWCRRGLAINRHGDGLVNTAPAGADGPVAWSLAGAVMAAFSSARARWAFEQELAALLDAFQGTTDMDGWCAAADRQPEEVIALALAAERRLGLGPLS